MSHILDEQKRYYAARAPEYDDWWYRRGRYAFEPEEQERWDADIAEADAALESFAPRGNVLELAAGTGIWTRKLVRLAERVVAVDANAEPLALNTPEAELVQADLFGWRPPERFDVVFFSFWLSHVPEERFDEFWELVRSALADGGRIFLIDSGPEETEPGDDRQVRQLADGREFRIVKRFWQPEELAERVRPGFDLDLRLTASGNFLYGFGS
ncbi:MAG TPA: class I SAM-dependent methyltransferase [Gaiellaceae bacterium]|nr:class I SAM-dependent methyltransferase [Gaiellaceae bacterium]